MLAKEDLPIATYKYKDEFLEREKDNREYENIIDHMGSNQLTLTIDFEEKSIWETSDGWEFEIDKIENIGEFVTV